MVEAVLILTIAVFLLPPVKNILTSLYTEMVVVIPSLTPFEALVMNYYPIVLLVLVFAAVVMVVRRSISK